ncbi:MAG: hypothetical protein AB1411_06600 [Nitrospirota bacterium]
MPYVFPYEEAFVVGVGALIAGLLLFRIAVARKRARESARSDRTE